MNSFNTIREILRIARQTRLDDGKMQLVITDGNTYDNNDSDTAVSEDFNNKVIVDVMCANGTDSDIINYCNAVTDIAIAYGISNDIVIQPSSSYDHSVSREEYLYSYQPNGICIEWNGGDVIVKVLLDYRQG